jgi:hypothetical protein
MTESQIREATRKALDEQRDFHDKALKDPMLSLNDREHHVVSKTQIESAQRILWMENA